MMGLEMSVAELDMDSVRGAISELDVSWAR
jgi:hypothetical protein